MSGFSTTGFVKIGTTVIGCENINYNPQIKTENIATAGMIIPAASVSLGSSPIFQCTTKDVISALGLNLIATDMASTSVDVYAQHFKSGGTLETSLTKYAMAKGIAIVEVIQGEIGSILTAQIGIYPASSDGTASPITFTEEGATAPTYTKPSNWLACGTYSINGTTIAKSTGFSLAFNHQIVQEPTQGGYYPIDCYSRGYAPVLSIKTYDGKSARTLITEKGKALTAAGATAVLYQTDSNGVLGNTAAKTITIHSGLAVMNERNYNQGATTEISIDVHAAYDATNPAIEVA